MADSALFGYPPKTEDDLLIVKGLGRVVGIYPGKLDPTKGLPPYQVPLDAPDPHIGGAVYNANFFAIVFVTLLTTTRLLIRAYTRSMKFGWDDWTIIPALMAYIVFFSLQIFMFDKGGVGHHIGKITYYQNYLYQKGATLSALFYFGTAAFVKISIAMFNRRLTDISSRAWHIANIIFVLVMISYLITVIALSLTTCTPHAINFDLISIGKLPLSTYLHCRSGLKVYLGLTIVHIVTDLALLSVPIIIVVRLKCISLSRKIRLGALFAIGALSVLGSLMRMVEQMKLNPDGTWEHVAYNKWMLVDLTFGITAASLPILSAFFGPSRWRSMADHLASLKTSPFRRRKHNHDVSRRLPSVEDAGNPPHSPYTRRGRHHDQLPTSYITLAPMGEKYIGKGPDEMSLAFQDEAILNTHAVPDVERMENLCNNSRWDASDETIGVTKPTPSWRDGLER